MIFANPRIEVSGVRSSCETVEMKSVFIRSTSRSTVMSRTRTTVPRETPSDGSTMALATARPSRPWASGISRVAASVEPMPSSSGRTCGGGLVQQAAGGSAQHLLEPPVDALDAPRGVDDQQPLAEVVETPRPARG